MTDAPFNAMTATAAECAARLRELTAPRRSAPARAEAVVPRASVASGTTTSTARAPAAVAGKPAFDARTASKEEFEKALKEITRPVTRHTRLNGVR